MSHRQRRKRVFGLVKDFGTSQSPKSTRPLTTYWCPSRPGHQALRNNFASSLLLRTWLPYDWTPRSEAYFVFPLAQGTPGKQCGLAATGDYQPSLRSPWLAAVVYQVLIRNNQTSFFLEILRYRPEPWFFHLKGLNWYYFYRMPHHNIYPSVLLGKEGCNSTRGVLIASNWVSLISLTSLTSLTSNIHSKFPFLQLLLIAYWKGCPVCAGGVRYQHLL